MIEVLVAFVLGAAMPSFFLWRLGKQSELREIQAAAERLSLIDRIQSPDLVSYYGARSAYHPEDFPEVETPEFAYDDYGFVRETLDNRTPTVLPGEMPPDAA